MNKEEARNIIECFIKCPFALRDTLCEKDDYCDGFCWSVSKLKEAIDIYYS